MTTRTRTTVERCTISPIGCALSDAAAHLKRLMRAPRTRLVDIRYQPRSTWNLQWNRAPPLARYDRRFMWERRLGRDTTGTESRASGCAEGHSDGMREAGAILCEGSSLVLLCACTHART